MKDLLVRGRPVIKTNTLIIALAFLLLFVGSVQIYSSANKVRNSNVNSSVSRPRRHSIESIDTKIIEYSHRCNDAQHSTLKCPLGKRTPAVYHQSMDSLYNNITGTETFRKCSNLRLPLTESDPIECWPRLIILPSHTTSGSKLFRNIWDLFGMSMSQYHEPRKKSDKIFSLFNESLNLWGTLDETSAIPFMKQPIIFKSHIFQGKESNRGEEARQLLARAKSIGVLHGVIRMARNPGDQLLRNKVRWDKGQKSCTRPGSRVVSEFDCFVQQAKKHCREVYGRRGRESVLSVTYNIFHSFWNNDNLGIPQMTIYYEHMAWKKDVSAAIQSVLTFLGENNLGYNIAYMQKVLDTRLDQVTEMVNEPDYEHGTLLARICGVSAARIIHDETRNNSEALGYIFDNETGYWSLSI